MREKKKNENPQNYFAWKWVAIKCDANRTYWFFLCVQLLLYQKPFFGWWPCSHQPPFVVSVTLPVKLPCIVRNRNWAQNNKDLQKNRKSYNILLLSTFSKRCTKHSSWNDRKQSMVFSQLLLKGESSRESQPFGMLWQFRSNDFFFCLVVTFGK